MALSGGHLFNKILALAIFDGRTQSGFDQLSQDLTNSVTNIGGGFPPPPLEPSLIPSDNLNDRLEDDMEKK